MQRRGSNGRLERSARVRRRAPHAPSLVAAPRAMRMAEDESDDLDSWTIVAPMSSVNRAIYWGRHASPDAPPTGPVLHA